MYLTLPVVPSSLLLFLLLLLLHPSSTFPAGKPGASDQMEFFHFIFPALCTISNSIIPALIPRAFALYFMCTLVPSSSSWLSVKPNLHGLLSTIIPDELSKTKEKYFHKNNYSRQDKRSCFLLSLKFVSDGDLR